MNLPHRIAGLEIADKNGVADGLYRPALDNSVSAR